MFRWCAAAYTDTVGSPFHKTVHCNPLDSSIPDSSCCYRNLHSDRNTRLPLSIVVSTLYEDLHTYIQLYEWTQEAYIIGTLCHTFLTTKLCAVWSRVITWALTVWLAAIRATISAVVTGVLPAGNGWAVWICRRAMHHTEGCAVSGVIVAHLWGWSWTSYKRQESLSFCGTFQVCIH